MNFNIEIMWGYHDKYGRFIIEKQHKANTLLQGFFGNLCSLFLGNIALTTGIKDTGNTVRKVTGYLGTFNVIASAGDATLGIVVGTSDQAVDVADYVLITPIAHGVGAGQLSFGSTGVDSDITTAASEVYFTMARTFVNSSGGDIAIAEVGIYGRGQISSSIYKFMFDRTLSSYTIANGATRTLTYKIGASE
jgi:hypothetical protein